MKKTLAAALLAAALVLAPTAASSAAPKIDFDFTRFSATMVYAQVFDMLISPERYDGKVIRMKGTFEVFEYEEGGVLHRSFACVVRDSTACCVQGMEFALAGEARYPDDYPSTGSDIIITGRYKKEIIDGLIYTKLVDCAISK